MTSPLLKLQHTYPGLVGRIATDEPLARHGSLRIGGPAQYWAEPHSIDELLDTLRWACASNLTPHIVGLGSNTLFPDEGIQGVVIRLRGELAAWSIEDDGRARVGAGALNAHLVRGLLKQGWVNHEFLALIPGTFGGAVAMNAGTKAQELSTILTRATLVVPEAGTYVLREYDAHELKMAYRHCELPEGSLVVEGVIQVEQGDVDAARERVTQDKSSRNRTQPYKLASVGSTFANPPGDAAGRLIEACGLKGHRRGHAQISALHANFFINEGGASAEDFLYLMALARVRVRKNFGVELRPEVWFVGFDGHAALTALEHTITQQDKEL